MVPGSKGLKNLYRPLHYQRVFFMTYSEKLKDPRWKEKRDVILRRDNRTCRWCGAKGGEMEVHHTIYFGLDPWEYRDESMITLCPICHSEAERLLHEIKVYLAFIQMDKIWQLDNVRVLLMRFLVERNKYDYQQLQCLMRDRNV